MSVNEVEADRAIIEFTQEGLDARQYATEKLRAFGLTPAQMYMDYLIEEIMRLKSKPNKEPADVQAFKALMEQFNKVMGFDKKSGDIQIVSPLDTSANLYNRMNG